MTAGHPATVAAATVLPEGARWKIFFYLSVPILLLEFGGPAGGLMNIPVSFVLKNKLHLHPHESAIFLLISAIPLYLSSGFGFIRDIWNPFGMGDRGFLILFGGISAVLYVLFAFTPITYTSLLVSSFILTISFRLASSAWQGLASTIGQQHVMSGQISAAWNILLYLVGAAALFAGGGLSVHLESENADRAISTLFLAGAALMALVAVYAAWKPRAVFDNVHSEREPSDNIREDLKRLLRHWPVWPAMLIWLLWNFQPGTATSLQYYLQNRLHASDADWGLWNAINTLAFIPAFFLFGFLCQHYSLRTMLFVGTLVALPQSVPLLFMHTVAGAMIAAVPIGLMGGIATAAYLDLVIRSCPRALQGTTLMLAASFEAIATRFGDVLGTNLYSRQSGFALCVMVTTAVYVLILPLLLLVPKRLTVTADNEVPDVPFAADPEGEALDGPLSG